MKASFGRLHNSGAPPSVAPESNMVYGAIYVPPLPLQLRRMDKRAPISNPTFRLVAVSILFSETLLVAKGSQDETRHFSKTYFYYT